MAKLSKKERRALAQRERQAREQARSERCPLNREEFEALYEFVAERVFREGHDGDATWIRQWLSTRDDSEAVVHFLVSEGITADFDVLIRADPYTLFGKTATRLARMPLSRSQLQSLIEALDQRLRKEPCPHDLRYTREWLEQKGLPLATTEFALIAQGGGCDCEVVLNVDPETIYPR